MEQESNVELLLAQAKAIVETCAQSEAAMARASASAMVARSKEKARCMKFGDNQEMKYGGKREEERGTRTNQQIQHL